MISNERLIRFEAFKHNDFFKWEVTKNTIAEITPTTGTQETCLGGWIRAVNDTAPAMHGKKYHIDHKAAEKTGKQGKWIIRFSKGDTLINDIWKKVVEGVRIGVFCEAKASVPNEKFQEQVILVYTIDHECEEDVMRCRNEIVARKIISANQEIKYKTESATLKNLDEYKYIYKHVQNKGLLKRITNAVLSPFQSIGQFCNFMSAILIFSYLGVKCFKRFRS